MSPTQTPPRPRSSHRTSSSSARPAQRITLASQSRRGVTMLVITTVIFTIFAGRLIDLQVVKGDELASAALDQRLRTESVPSLRGAILDANGEPLAVTVEARNVTADQTLIADPQAVGAALAPILGADADVLATRLTGTRRFVYLAKGVTPETWREIADLRLPGVFSEDTSRRIYPGDELAANVVGFVGADGTGLAGVEYAYQEELAGVAGSRTYERGPGGRVIPTAQRSTTEGTPGVDITLTIDRDIQHVAQQEILHKVWETGSRSGTVVVMDPKTGEILALATAPTFNANEAAIAASNVRGNRALSDTYEPGSTSKLMTIAAVIDQGMASARSTFKIPPVLRRGGEAFNDHTPHGTLNLTLAGIMAKSSNIGTILAAERIGGRTLYRYLKKFGVAEPTGLNFPGESNGVIPDYADWSATSFPTIAFGQGLTMNSVQSASVYATIANDGVRVEPTLIKSVVNGDGEVQQAPQPKKTRVVSADAARQVRQMLEAVVGDGGTGSKATIPGYRVGGKTGTANFVEAGTGRYSRDIMASFIGMAPADNPQLVVAVSLVAPQRGRYGGEVAAPVFRDVMSYALQARHIPPSGDKAPKLALTYGG